MAFDAGALFAHIIAVKATRIAGLNRLAIETAGTRCSLATLLLENAFAQSIIEQLLQAAFMPPMIVTINRLKWGKVE
jgi:hypothetical protein